MRDIARIERIMNALTNYWKQHPDWRFCQFMENIKTFSRYDDMYYVEDDEFEALIHDFFLTMDIASRSSIDEVV